MDLSDDLLGAPPSILGAQIDIDLGSALSRDVLSGDLLRLDLALPAGFVLRQATCPAGVSLAIGGFGSVPGSVSGSGTGLADCVLSIVNVAAASAAVLPAIVQRNDLLLSVELGLDQQLDRFGGDSAASEDLPKPFGLGALSGGTASSAFDDGSRMGLTTDGANGRSSSFSASLQQMQRSGAREAPSMLGAGSRRPGNRVSRDFNIWTEGYVAYTESDFAGAESDGHTAVIYAGADYLISPHLLLGALVQYDDQDRSFDGAPMTFGERGWLAGPYAVLKLSDTVFFQTRAAWGQSENDVRFDGVFDDSFDSSRWLVKGRLIANLRSGPWLLRPSASIAYIEDRLDGYRSSSGVDIAGRTLSLGQLKAGPEISYRFMAAGGFAVTPSLSLEGIWNFDQGDGAAGFDDLADAEDVRGRVEAGTTIQNGKGVSFGAAVSYDGIGSSDFQAIGGRARVSVPLN